MLKQVLQNLEIARLQADVMRLTESNAQLKTELSSLQLEYERYRADELNRKADFLDIALKSLIQSGAITDNRSNV